MTDQNQREWPSFGDILSELNSLGRLSATYGVGSVRDASQSAADGVEAAPGDTLVDEQSATVDTGDSLAEGDLAELPDELPAAEIDTTPLEASFAESSSLESLDVSALEPLLPATDLSESHDDEPAADESPESETINGTEPDDETEPSEPQQPEPESPFDSPVVSPFETESPGVAPVQAFAPTELAGTLDPLSGEIDWSSSDWADDQQPAAPQLGDWSAIPQSFDDQPIGEPAIDDIADPHQAGTVFPMNAAGHDMATHGEMVVDDAGPQAQPTDAELLAQEPRFDSVATANAIEEELQDLFTLDQVPEDEDNVVPLHSSSDDHSDAVVGLDTVFDQDADHEPLQEWVGIDPEELRPKDPWAHMRPSEEDDKSRGFWSGRPKFFGGDERKARRESRNKADGGLPDESVDPDGPPCPSCHSPGQVDLDDPIGQRQHLSCSACGQVWSQPRPADKRSA